MTAERWDFLFGIMISFDLQLKGRTSCLWAGPPSPLVPPPERLSPPRNITGSCNASHCAVSWVPPRTWAAMSFADFRYQLDLRSTVRAPQRMLGNGGGGGRLLL